MTQIELITAPGLEPEINQVCISSAQEPCPGPPKPDVDINRDMCGGCKCLKKYQKQIRWPEHAPAGEKELWFEVTGGERRWCGVCDGPLDKYLNLHGTKILFLCTTCNIGDTVPYEKKCSKCEVRTPEKGDDLCETCKQVQWADEEAEELKQLQGNSNGRST